MTDIKEIQTRLRQVEVDLEVTNRRINKAFTRLMNANKRIDNTNKRQVQIEHAIIGLYDMVELEGVPEYLHEPLAAIKKRRLFKEGKGERETDQK